MKISIIVPVYNVQEYIYECIESLCNQTLNNIEIIVINDGTKDKSVEIVKEFKDTRIRIISQENAGLSAARNAGVRIAKGEYITFVDGDDFIAFYEAYEEMYNIAIKENSDIVAGNAIWYYSKEKKYSMPMNSSMFSKSPMNSEEFFMSCMKSNKIYAPVCFNLYKRNLLIDNYLVFKEGIYHEDEEFTPRVLLKANKVSIYNKDFYVYRQREGSIMNSNSNLNSKKGTDFLSIYMSLEEVFDDIKNEELKYLFKRYLTRIAIDKIYMYKLKKISTEVKNSINRNSVTKGIKIRSLILNINESLFLFIETIYRKSRKMD